MVRIVAADDCSNINADPQSFTVHADQTLFVDWQNASPSFPVDVWMSYNGGFTDLQPGSTWNEPIEHCTNINPHLEYADITTACSSFRVNITCE